MYNAVEEDERELRNILVAVPVLVTFMLIFGPYMLGLFAAEKVRVAVDERIKEAENALKAATEASSSLTEKMELKIERERALLFARLAYLHWSLDDAELATHYAGRASQTADRALERAPGDSALRNFLQDINQSFAYYTAELWGPLMSGSDDMVEAARKSGVQMLNELAGCKSSEIDLEVLDSCLFVIWTFRNLISDSDKAAAVILYRNWALALESRKWKKLQRGNYDRYRPYYESFR